MLNLFVYFFTGVQPEIVVMILKLLNDNKFKWVFFLFQHFKLNNVFVALWNANRLRKSRTKSGLIWYPLRTQQFQFSHISNLFQNIFMSISQALSMCILVLKIEKHFRIFCRSYPKDQTSIQSTRSVFPSTSIEL